MHQRCVRRPSTKSYEPLLVPGKQSRCWKQINQSEEKNGHVNKSDLNNIFVTLLQK